MEIDRLQVPLRSCDAVTYHRVQSRTFKIVCVDLRNFPFTHGSLYVAMYCQYVEEEQKMCVYALWNKTCVTVQDTHSRQMLFIASF